MINKSEIWIGTSGWHYNDWKGIFYPQDIKGADELSYFSKHFNTVENNSSFYHLPKVSTFKKWHDDVPGDFLFSVKLNRFITHTKRLVLDEKSKETTIYFLKAVQELKTKLGAIVIQLPASFKFDIPRLTEYLEFISKEIKKLKYKPNLTIEFRNSIWFNEETYEILRKHNVALVIADSSKYPGSKVVTADFAYIRFHGPKALFASKYTSKQMSDWANFIKTLKKLKRIYIYFNNDFYGYAIDNARELSRMLELERRG